MIKTFLSCLLLTFLVLQINAQTSAFNKLPVMLPASPEASAINKGAALSAGLFTGAANASIPLGEISLSGLSVPVSLNYSGNGLKVDEIPGRTGLGWNLSTAGVISRIVHDLPDDGLNKRMIMPADFPNLSLANSEFLRLKQWFPQLWDTEPDEFRVDAPGLSLRFVIDNNGQPIIIPHGNEKITINGGIGINGNQGSEFSSFTITNANGMIYKFGGLDKYGEKATEITQSHNSLGGNITGISRIKTAFYLTEITAPNKDVINFFYNPIVTVNHLGVTNKLVKGILEPNPEEVYNLFTIPSADAQATVDACIIGNLDLGNSHFSQKLSNVNYETVYLKKITASNGQVLSLTYESRGDGGGDNRIKSISFNGIGISKKFDLRYEEPLTNNNIYFNNNIINARFFLHEITTYLWKDNMGDDAFINVDTLKYKLEYYDNTNLPKRLSYSQDHLGFNNGQNNQNLLPANYLPNGEFNSYANANRNYNGNESKKGMLKKITLPTGGYEAFEYEPNKTSEYKKTNTTTTINIAGQGSNSGTVPTLSVYNSSTFQILRTQTMKLNINTNLFTPCNEAYPICEPFVANVNTIAKLEILDNTGSIIFSILKKEYGGWDINVPITPGGYSLKLNVYGFVNIANASLRYDFAAQDIYAWEKVEIGGVRVKKMITYDPVSAKETSKNYKYTSLNELDKDNGISNITPKYFSKIEKRIRCSYATSGGSYTTAVNNHVEFLYSAENDDVLLNYNYTTYASNNIQGMGGYQDNNIYLNSLTSSTSPLIYTYNGSHVAYPKIIESDNENFKNGGIEYAFNISPSNQSYTLQGELPNYLPNNTITNITGFPFGNKVFNSNKQILKEDRSYYHLDTAANKSLDAWVIDLKWVLPYFTGSPNPYMPFVTEGFKAFNIGKYVHLSNWIQKDSTITIEYDLLNNDSLKTIEKYGYGTPNNVQPIFTESINSKKQVVKSQMKYPTDLQTIAPYNKMVSNNILTPVIETESFNNNISTGKVRNEFFDWHPGGVIDPIIIAPKKIWAKRGSNAEESRMQYFGYDTKGHPLEVAKEGGAKVSYIWGYNNNFPIAEIKNASVINDGVAYTSFETDEKGHWSYSGSSVGAGTSLPPTGGACYNLSNGAISKTINFAKNYFLTYWIKDGSGIINVNSSSNKVLISRNGWSCYEHKISNNTITNITITGTALIDELRLYPEGSFMTTMTHRPFVGITSRNEPNNQIVYYEYDGSGRLIRIRDMDRNIVKQLDYQYKKQILPCTNTLPNWVQANNYKCEQGGTSNNYTGNRLVEQIDMNNCSDTYLNNRWINEGYHPSCQPIAGCADPSMRLVLQGGVLVCETGNKILVSSTRTSIRPTRYECVFHYVWTDGFVGPDFTELSATSCSILSGIN